MITNEKYLSYDDILLIPRFSNLETRSIAITECNLCGFNFKLPIVPANMLDVVDIKLCEYLSQNGYFYIYHRGLDNTLDFVRIANFYDWKLISISTGVNEDTLNVLKDIKEKGFRVDFICIDVAHGWHSKVRDRIKWIKDNFPATTKIIAGNVASPEAYRDLGDWGADVVKVGIGQGSICTTKFQTGFSMPMFSCIKNIDSYKKIYNGHVKDVPIIADGGIKYYGDIAKSLVAGADMVMSGGLFASCLDSPAKIVDNKKEYRGSTSFAVKKVNKHIEGRIVNLEADIKFLDKLDEIEQALKSSISYAGGKDLSCFRNVSWVRI